MPDPSSAAVHVADLRKTFSVPVREAGLVAAAKSLVKRESREIKAVDGVAFEIEPGEVVGFLGPNGAGKTTTLKMLSGLLYPTSGEALVLGYVPSTRERDVPAPDHDGHGQPQPAPVGPAGARLVRADPGDLPARRPTTSAGPATSSSSCSISAPLVNKPVRNLSLGERMKMEFVAALLHKPQVLFLDEPTLGLDVTMQKRIRTFVAEYNRRYGATVLLTSHYMADVQALCKRVIVIHHGRMLFDGALTELATRFNATKTIGVTAQATGPPTCRPTARSWRPTTIACCSASPAPTRPTSRRASCATCRSPT